MLDALIPGRQEERESMAQEVEKSANDAVLNVDTMRSNRPDLYALIIQQKQSATSNELALCHAANESGFLNSEGAQHELGLFQIKLSTANGLGLGKFTKQQVLMQNGLNTRLATTHLQVLINKFAGNVRMALAAYKQGETRLAREGMTHNAQVYVDSIIRCETILHSRR